MNNEQLSTEYWTTNDEQRAMNKDQWSINNEHKYLINE